MFIILFQCTSSPYFTDGIDGKQARRTQSSTPLGELFDHGLVQNCHFHYHHYNNLCLTIISQDSWTSFFIPAVLYSVFGRLEHSISPLRLYFCLINVLITFLFSHFEKYNTGVLFLPWGYDVSQLCALIIYLITFFAGFEIWKFTLPGGITAGAVFELMMWSGSLLTSLPVSIYNIYKYSFDARLAVLRSKSFYSLPGPTATGRARIAPFGRLAVL